MIKASSSWLQFLNQLPEIKAGSPKRQYLKRFSEPGTLLGLLTLIVGMLIWNWRLLLALTVGIGVMLGAYSIQKRNWHLVWTEISKFLQGANSQLVLAVFSGGFATVITYIAAVIWVDGHSPEIAILAIAQTLLTLLTLTVLVWQILNLNGQQEQNQIDQLLNNFTASDPLTRLLAVRQLHKLIIRQQIDQHTQHDVITCLQMLLRREEETAIREVAIDSLQTLDNLYNLSSLSAPTAKPLQPIIAKVKQKVY